MEGPRHPHSPGRAHPPIHARSELRGPGAPCESERPEPTTLTAEQSSDVDTVRVCVPATLEQRLGSAEVERLVSFREGDEVPSPSDHFGVAMRAKLEPDEPELEAGKAAEIARMRAEQSEQSMLMREAEDAGERPAVDPRRKTLVGVGE